MQPHDPELLPPNSHPDESSPPAELPDDTSRTEAGRCSVEFEPGTGRTLKLGAGIAGGILVFCFCVVMVLRLVEAHTLRKGADAAYSAPPPVDVITAQPASVGQDLVLPGQTAAWYETTIYARVNGYVAKWLVDIGDHVKKGQVLATHRDPRTRCRAQRRARATEGLRSSGRARARRRLNSARPPTSAGATRPRAWSRSRNASRRRPTTKAPTRACLRPMPRSRSTNPRSISTPRSRSSSRWWRRSTAPSPSARSTSAIWSRPAADRPRRRSTGWRKRTLCASSSTCRRTRPIELMNAGVPARDPRHRAGRRRLQGHDRPLGGIASTRRRAPCASKSTCPTPITPCCPAPTSTWHSNCNRAAWSKSRRRR